MGRHYYVLLRRHNEVPIRRRGGVQLRHRWVFYLRRTYDFVGTSRETSDRSCCRVGRI